MARKCPVSAALPIKNPSVRHLHPQLGDIPVRREGEDMGSGGDFTLDRSSNRSDHDPFFRAGVEGSGDPFGL